MENYYKLLNVSESASYDSIKRAYRKLALKYHPDRNQNNPAATEKFKRISIAYDTLSSPAKRSRYDAKLEYTKFHKTTRSTTAHTSYTRTTQSTTQRKSQRRKRKTTANPTFDTTIPKTRLSTKQFWTVFTLATIFVSGIIGSAHYSQYHDKKVQEEKALAIRIIFEKYQKDVELNFANGNYEACIEAARELSPKLNIFGVGHNEQDKIQFKVLEEGTKNFYSKNYPKAIKAFEALIAAGDNFVKTDQTYAFLGRAYYNNNQPEKIYGLLSEIETNNYPEIPTLLAIVSRDFNKDNEAAIHWHQVAKNVLQGMYKNMGFQFVPNDAPQTHFNAYYQSAITNYNVQDYGMALDDLSGALFLRSANRDALYMKGLCERKVGWKERACESFRLAKKNGNVLADEQLENCY